VGQNTNRERKNPGAGSGCPNPTKVPCTIYSKCARRKEKRLDKNGPPKTKTKKGGGGVRGKSQKMKQKKNTAPSVGPGPAKKKKLRTTPLATTTAKTWPTQQKKRTGCNHTPGTKGQKKMG